MLETCGAIFSFSISACLKAFSSGPLSTSDVDLACSCDLGELFVNGKLNLSFPAG